MDHCTSKIRVGDIVITGNGERMKIEGSVLEKIYVGRVILPEGKKGKKTIDRSQRVKNALLPASGWAGSMKEVGEFLKGEGLTKFVDRIKKEESKGERQTPPMNVQERARKYLGSGLMNLIGHGTTLTTDLPTMCLSETERSEILKVVESSRVLMSALKRRGAGSLSDWVKSIIDDGDPGEPRFGDESSKKYDVTSFASISSRLQQCMRRDPGTSIKELPPQLTNKEIGKWCIKHARVVLCTVSSTGKSEVKGSGPFDLAVIDEAAQLVEAEAILAFRLTGIQKMVLVGDPKQLPATVMSEVCEVR